MRLSSSPSSSKPAASPRLRITKTQSLHERILIQNEQYSPSKLKSKMSLAPSLIVQASEEVEQMGMFVEEVAMDPSLRNRLVDYHELIASLQEQHNQLKTVTLQKQQQLHAINQTVAQLNGSEGPSKVDMLKEEEEQINSEIKRYMQITIAEREMRLKRKEQKRNRQKVLLATITLEKEKNQLTVEELNKSIKMQGKKKIQTNKQIQQIQQKIRKLKSKASQNDNKIKQNSKLSNKIIDIRHVISELKKKQSQQLQNYRNMMVKKKTNESELKKDSEKKLSKFVTELAKILQSGNYKQFCKFVAQHEDKRQNIREKNSSSDTKPDQDEQQHNKHETSLQNLQSKNPTLKNYRQMKLTSIEHLYRQKPPQEQKQKNMQLEQQINRSAQQADEKIKKLVEEEADVESFLGSLRDKISKIDGQLVGGGKGK